MRQILRQVLRRFTRKTRRAAGRPEVTRLDQGIVNALESFRG